MLTNLKQTVWSFHTLLLVLTFLSVRLFSFLISPYPIIVSLSAGLLILLLWILFVKRPEYAWHLLLAELLLGGSGHLFELFGISLRTIFLFSAIFFFAFDWIFRRSQKQRTPLLVPKPLYILFGAFFLVLTIAVLNGMLQGNNFRLMVQDTLPFAFFALIFPFHQIFKNRKTQKFLIQLVSAFILGSFLFSLFTFILFSSGTVLLQEPYYKWFRDVLAGKITDLGNGFWRIVTPEHLLLLPITLIVASLCMSSERKNRLSGLLLPALFVLTLNLSRGYFLALFVAVFVLLFEHSFKRWFFTTTLIGLSSLIFFCGTFWIASGGNTLGLDVFGLRVNSFTAPQIEESTYTRTALLDPIFQKIQERPFFGSGLGSTVTFIHPSTNQPMETNQFDWGYLELLSEFGILGTTVFLTLIFSLCFLLIQHIRTTSLFPDFMVGLLGGMVSLLVATLTAPALFHVFGILFLCGVSSTFLFTNSFWEKLTNKLATFWNQKISSPS